jgi:hypothetical protein
MHLFRLITLGALWVLIGSYPVNTYSAQEAIIINVASPQESWLFHTVSPFKEIKLISHDATENGKAQLYNSVSNTVREKTKNRNIYSYDCRYFAVVSHDSRQNSIKLSYRLMNSKEQMVEYIPKEEFFISDLVWSTDSKYLLVLEVHNSISKTPSSLFRALFGHGDTQSTFRITTIDIESGESYHQVLASDIHDGIAMLDGYYGACVDAKQFDMQ